MKPLWIIIIVAIFSACQTSKITHTWTAGETIQNKYKKILVLGVLNDGDRELQSKMEDHLASDISHLGYHVYASNKIFSPGTFVKGDTARAVAAINSQGFDAVLTIVLLDKKKEKFYIAGWKTNTQFSTYHYRFDEYYFSVYDRVHTEGYYADDTKLFWQSNFYDIENKKMIYSAQTRSFDPGSKESLAHYYGVLIVNDLKKNRIVFEQ